MAAQSMHYRAYDRVALAKVPDTRKRGKFSWVPAAFQVLVGTTSVATGGGVTVGRD